MAKKLHGDSLTLHKQDNARFYINLDAMPDRRLQLFNVSQVTVKLKQLWLFVERFRVITSAEVLVLLLFAAKSNWLMSRKRNTLLKMEKEKCA